MNFCVAGPLTKGVRIVCAVGPEGTLFAIWLGNQQTAQRTGWRFYNSPTDTLSPTEVAGCKQLLKMSVPFPCSFCGDQGCSSD